MSNSPMRHPAKFHDETLRAIQAFLPSGLVLDPFAGTGKVHMLHSPDTPTYGVEIEPEWANLHPRTFVGNALSLPFPDASFSSIVTSPCYGNRMADHHKARDLSTRNTYRHTLGRPLHEDSSGKLQWGKRYRIFHRRAWRECKRVLQPNGSVFLNVSDHVRKGEIQPVSRWHIDTFLTLGFCVVDMNTISTPGLRFGDNAELRTKGENLIRFTREA